MATHRAERSDRARVRRRARSRRRVGVLGASIGVTALIGTAAVAVSPTVRSDRADVSGPSALSSTRLAEIAAPAPSPDPEPATDAVQAAATVELPKGSGQGRRIVFDQSDQRVWLIEDGEKVARTYPVSGSRFDNLQPGSYVVQSKQEHAVAFDASGTMDYFVRFATGYSEPIGFHSVPRDNAGRLEQTKAQLGTPLSAGCVRQWRNDAIALWDFAPIGTKVTVTA